MSGRAAQWLARGVVGPWRKAQRLPVRIVTRVFAHDWLQNGCNRNQNHADAVGGRGSQTQKWGVTLGVNTGQTMAILQNTDLRILVVDDQESVRSHLSQELLRMGVKQVLEAASAEEALAAFEQHQPDLVLLDILMPGKNGYWIAERIRDLEDGRWTPIIFLTGMGRDEDLWEGIRTGGDDYLVKPVRATVLAAKIRAMQRLLTMQRQAGDRNGGAVRSQPPVEFADRARCADGARQPPGL